MLLSQIRQTSQNLEGNQRQDEIRAGRGNALPSAGDAARTASATRGQPPGVTKSFGFNHRGCGPAVAGVQIQMRGKTTPSTASTNLGFAAQKSFSQSGPSREQHNTRGQSYKELLGMFPCSQPTPQHLLLELRMGKCIQGNEESFTRQHEHFPQRVPSEDFRQPADPLELTAILTFPRISSGILLASFNT